MLSYAHKNSQEVCKTPTIRKGCSTRFSSGINPAVLAIAEKYVRTVRYIICYLILVNSTCC